MASPKKPRSIILIALPFLKTINLLDLLIHSINVVGRPACRIDLIRSVDYFFFYKKGKRGGKERFR